MRFGLLGAWATAALLVGCAALFEGPPDVFTCERDDQCERWQACVDEQCLDVPPDEDVGQPPLPDGGPPDAGQPCGDDVGGPCPSGRGACAVEGTWTCEDGERRCRRPSGAPEPRPEDECNGLDDDCDGAVDEPPRPGETPPPELELGASCTPDSAGPNCETGTQQCVGGEVACVADNAVAELCDGVDNDCDGSTDEDAWAYDPVEPAECDAERVDRSGFSVRTCDGVAAGAEQREVRLDAVDEVCNGIDDDGDCRVDELTGDPSGPCVVPDSARPGRCAMGTYACTAEAGDVVALLAAPPQGHGAVDWPAEADVVCRSDGHTPEPEACNGIDDDCDGAPDNIGDVVRGGACSTGVMDCAAVEGVWDCDEGAAPIERLHCRMPVEVDDPAQCVRCVGVQGHGRPERRDDLRAPRCNGAGAEEAPVFVPRGWAYVGGRAAEQGVPAIGPYLIEIGEHRAGDGPPESTPWLEATSRAAALVTDGDFGHEVEPCYGGCDCESGMCTLYTPRPDPWQMLPEGAQNGGVECRGPRLPLRREWDHAARFSTGELLPEGDCGAGAVDAYVVDSNEELDDALHADRCNDRGLCDMLGSVAEWMHPSVIVDADQVVVGPASFGGFDRTRRRIRYCPDDASEPDPSELYANAPQSEAEANALDQVLGLCADNNDRGHRLVIPLPADPLCPPTGCPTSQGDDP